MYVSACYIYILHMHFSFRRNIEVYAYNYNFIIHSKNNLVGLTMMYTTIVRLVV